MVDFKRVRCLAAGFAGACLVAVTLPSRAAQDPPAPALSAAPPRPERLRPLASFGGAIGGIGGYQGHGLGLLARAGAELHLFAAGGTRHGLVLALEAGRFSAWELDTPFVFEGVQLDLMSLRTDWRLYPWRGHGLYIDGGGGMLVARDRIAMQMPDREVSSTEWRLGVPIELAIGWMVADHLDVSFRYTQVVFTTKAPRSFGFLQLALGVRL
jgi:hypothetical protein